MKNYELLMGKISKWLSPNGRLFVHIFTFAHHSYHFEARDASDWMTTHFFSGGNVVAVLMMKCADMPLHTANRNNACGESLISISTRLVAARPLESER
jgi:cyclopropane fatty-acyl-phospholipid synthase-like methyltransferase